MNEHRTIATKVAWKFLGLPYIWGGDDPTGFDCSGYIISILKSVGILPRNGDWTAHGLWAKFKTHRTPAPHEGCLVFWESSTGQVTHVEYCLNSQLSIGASGGSSKTTSPAIAFKRDAYVKIRPFDTRPGIIGYVDPFMEVDNERDEIA